MKQLKFLAGLFILTFIASGCAVVSLYEAVEVVPDNIRNVYIEPVRNETQQVSLSIDLTEKIIDEFIKEGRLTVVGPEEADSTLRTTIIEYSKIPIAYDENFITEEYKLTIIVDLRYYDNIKKVKIFEEVRQDLLGGIEVWVKYYVGKDIELVETEEEARERLIEDVAKEILRRTVYGWR